jgi:hypothetical protein
MSSANWRQSQRPWASDERPRRQETDFDEGWLTPARPMRFIRLAEIKTQCRNIGPRLRCEPPRADRGLAACDFDSVRAWRGLWASARRRLAQDISGSGGVSRVIQDFEAAAGFENTIGFAFRVTIATRSIFNSPATCLPWVSSE